MFSGGKGVKLFDTLFTHQKEEAEVGQVSEEVLHAEDLRVEGKITTRVLVELLHVLVHDGQLLVLLPRMLAEAVGGTRLRKKGNNVDLM